MSTTSLICTSKGFAINTLAYTYTVEGEKITRVNDVNALTLSLTGFYSGNGTITWTNGEVWGKAGIIGNENRDTVILYIDISHIS